MRSTIVLTVVLSLFCSFEAWANGDNDSECNQEDALLEQIRTFEELPLPDLSPEEKECIRNNDLQDEINSANCRAEGITVQALVNTLVGWQKAEDADDSHRTIIHLLRGFLTEHKLKQSLPEEILLVCNRAGAVLSVARYQRNLEKGYLYLDLLVSQPGGKQRGGGTAVLKFLQKVALLEEKQGILLTPLDDEASQFYLNRGFEAEKPEDLKAEQPRLVKKSRLFHKEFAPCFVPQRDSDPDPTRPAPRRNLNREEPV